MTRMEIPTRRAGAAVIFVIVIMVVTPFLVGSALPRTHVISVSETIDVSAPDLFEFVADIDGWTHWRSDVDDVTRVSGDAAKVTVTSDNESLIYEIEIDSQNMIIKSQIVTTNIPYGGAWKIVVTRLSDSAARISVTETGFINSPIWRFIGKFFIGYSASAKRFLADLATACAGSSCKIFSKAQ